MPISMPILSEETQKLNIHDNESFKLWLKSWSEDYFNQIPLISKDIFETRLVAYIDDLRVSTFIIQIMESRFNYFQIEIEPVILAVLAGLVNNPGNAVMLAVVTSYLHRQKNTGMLDVEAFRDIFERRDIWDMKDEVLLSLWDAQKGHPHGMKTDNLLDQMTAELLR
jgi:hypothetical protein